MRKAHDPVLFSLCFEVFTIYFDVKFFMYFFDFCPIFIMSTRVLVSKRTGLEILRYAYL